MITTRHLETNFASLIPNNHVILRNNSNIITNSATVFVPTEYDFRTSDLLSACYR